MKPIQQRRLFFLTAVTSCKPEVVRFEGAITSFRPCGRIAAILAAALLFGGCSSLTPERVAVLAAIAGQAAQVGASEWLAKHPEHRDSFTNVIFALTGMLRNGDMVETNKTKFVELLSSLPVATLAGPDGELYVSGQPREKTPGDEAHLVIWDSALKKAVAVEGPALAHVMKATLSGLKRAVAPMPPAPAPMLPNGLPSDPNRVKRPKTERTRTNSEHIPD